MMFCTSIIMEGAVSVLVEIPKWAVTALKPPPRSSWPEGKNGAPMEETELLRRYHRLLRTLASRGLREVVWRSQIDQILERLDRDCSRLSALAGHRLRSELASQIEHEALYFSNPEGRAVLLAAVKRLEAGV